MSLKVAVIVASVDRGVDSSARLAHFAAEVADRGEILVMDSTPDGCGIGSARGLRNVRVLRKPLGMLAPELWRDGLDATCTPLVAFSTTAMMPEPGWLDAMIGRLEETGAAGVGGPIVPADGLNPTERAIYLLRYIRYYNPLCFQGDAEPPGDNALYRRESLQNVRKLINRGFWEVEIHHALRRRGARFEMTGEGRLLYQGGGRLSSTINQRLRHATAYGASRAPGMSTTERVARTAAAPLVLFVLMRRIASVLKAQGIAREPWLPALPSLALLATAWAAGEAAGIWTGVERSSRNAPLVNPRPEIV